jgi:hypothetical protein
MRGSLRGGELMRGSLRGGELMRGSLRGGELMRGSLRDGELTRGSERVGSALDARSGVELRLGATMGRLPGTTLRVGGATVAARVGVRLRLGESNTLTRSGALRLAGVALRAGATTVVRRSGTTLRVGGVTPGAVMVRRLAPAPAVLTGVATRRGDTWGAAAVAGWPARNRRRGVITAPSYLPPGVLKA